jgi:hypothetical protein
VLGRALGEGRRERVLDDDGQPARARDVDRFVDDVAGVRRASSRRKRRLTPEIT